MADKIGCFIIDLEGKELTAEERDLLAHPLVGGLIFFARNFESREQMIKLCSEVRAVRKNPCLLMVDQEGGRVQRFTNGLTRLPRMAEFGKIYTDSPEKASMLARDCGWLMATEILSLGIDLSLAPVLDLGKGLNTAIGDRAFHADPQIVSVLAAAFIQGMRDADMAATGKHFPGHGSVSVDSHLAMPVDDRDIATVTREDMLPFARLIKSGIPAIMAAHIVFPGVDSMPVGFSHYWLQTILRQQLGFSGTILSDDLNMEGAGMAGDYAGRVLAAREAGCDFALLCNNRRGVIQVLDRLPADAHQISRDKWTPLQGHFPSRSVHYQDNQRWQTTSQSIINIWN